MQIQYSPPYQRHVWNYDKDNKYVILPALQNVDWHLLFANNKTAHQEVHLLQNTILNVFKKIFPNNFITCCDRDSPLINDYMKTKSNRKILCTKIRREMTKRQRTMSY